MPFFSYKSLLKDLKTERISFVCVNSYNIIIREKEKKEENKINSYKYHHKKNKNSVKNSENKYFSKDDDMSHSFCMLF